MQNWKTTRRQLLIGGGAALGSTAVSWRTLAAPAAQGATAVPGGVLKVSVPERTTSLNPFVQLNSAGFLLNELLYMGITRLTEDMKPEGDAAASWDVNPEATEYVFTMRPDIEFHDGAKATAHDAVASIKAVLDPRNSSPAAKSIGVIDVVEPVDDRTFRIKLREPDGDLPVSLAHINLRLIPASVLNADPKVLDTKVAGSGPFQLVSHEPGRKTVMRKFERYFVPEEPYLDGIELMIYPDATAESTALINGQTDVMLRVANADYERVASTGNLVGHRQQTGGFLNIVLRVDAKPFDDPRVRTAIQYSLDRDALQEIVLEGFGRAAYDNVISPQYRFGLPLAPFKPDLDKARKLLEEAGHGNGIRFTCYAANSPMERSTLAVAFKEMVKPVGIDVDVKVIPYDEYVANVWKKAACYVAFWNMAPNEDSMYTQFLTSDAPYNDSGYKNPEFDELVRTGRQTTDEAKRTQAYHAAQHMLMRDVPWLVPFYRDYLSAHNNSVNGYTTHPLSYPHFMERIWLAEDSPARKRQI